jgi:hypothetical protein
MKKLAFAVLAVLGIALGTAYLVTPALAYSFAPPMENGSG